MWGVGCGWLISYFVIIFEDVWIGNMLVFVKSNI